MPCYDCGGYWECDGEGGECRDVPANTRSTPEEGGSGTVHLSGHGGHIEQHLDITIDGVTIPRVKVEASVHPVELPGSNGKRFRLVPRVTVGENQVTKNNPGGHQPPRGRKWEVSEKVPLESPTGQKVEVWVQSYLYPWVDQGEFKGIWPKVWIGRKP